MFRTSNHSSSGAAASSERIFSKAPSAEACFSSLNAQQATIDASSTNATAYFRPSSRAASICRTVTRFLPFLAA